MAERLALVLLLALAALPALALALAPGEPLPALRIDSPGELQLEGEQLHFAPWDSTRPTGTLHIVQYLAARKSAQAINQPFTDRLKQSGIPLERYHLTTIVNLGDAMFGTRSFVMSELESNKRRYYRSSIVADGDGLGRSLWGLAEKSSAVLVLDAGGRLLFFREGALSDAEIEQVLALVRGDAGRGSGATK